MSILSANLSVIPFASSIDSTRLQMASKYLSQAITHKNCEIPYVVCNKYEALTNYSNLGIRIAKNNGKIIYKNDDIIIYNYNNDSEIIIDYIPPIKRTHGSFGSSIRNCLNSDEVFESGDIIWEYDCFNQGIPTFGLNTNVAMIPFFGYDHEDAVVVSESYCEKAKVTYVDRQIVPVYKNSVFHKIYNNTTGSYVYFPGLGNKLIDQIICSSRIPKRNLSNSNFMSKDKNAELLTVMKHSNFSDFINSHYESDIGNKTRSKIERDGRITGFKVHKLRSDEMFDLELQNTIERMRKSYSNYIIDSYHSLEAKFPTNYVNKLMKRYFLYKDREEIRGDFDFKDAVYLIEFEITKESNSFIGDKLTTRSASKGVISLVLPDELMPVTLGNATNFQQTVDCMINPFGFFSRMNTGGATSEGIIGKSVMCADKTIKENPDYTIDALKWLDNCVIKYINHKKYSSQIKSFIGELESNNNLLTKFIENINKTNLYVEVPDFARINMRDLSANAVSANEDIMLKKQTIDYMKHKMKLSIPFKSEDVILKSSFVAPMYLMKLYKIAADISNSRDFGPIKQITGQPSKGRKKSGGSKLGQMEVEAIATHGCDKALKELLTVKSDWNEGKRSMLTDLVRTGTYELPLKSNDENIKGKTKIVIDTIIKFITE